MYIQFSVKNDSEEKHLINLIYDDTASIDEGAVQDYTFILRHNAFGEIPTEDNVKEYGWSAGYVSFPIAGLIKEDVAKITIKHNAHPFKNGRFDSLDSKEVSKTYDWKRVGFEQAGSAPTIPSPMHYKKFSVR